MRRILIVDDDVAVTNYLTVALMQTGRFESTTAHDSREVPERVEDHRPDLVLLDMDMPHVSGMDVLSWIRERGLDTPVIVLTGVSDVELAVRAMKLGAFDYLTKPVEDDHLLAVIDAALEHRQLQSSIDGLPRDLRREDLSCPDAFAQIPAVAPTMIRLLHQAERLAGSELSVFLWGERGTGKEMLARAIHSASQARHGNFVMLDASAFAADAFCRAFFGQAAGWNGQREATPGLLEEAEQGTVYLCEIEHLNLPAQVRLRRILQTGEYYREKSTEIRRCRVRFIVSSSHDLTSDAFQDTFSRDLLYHLMIHSLSVPPLRERMEDLPLLVEHFRKTWLQRVGKPIDGFTREFLDLLTGYDFPDNVQELRNIVQAAMVNADGPTVGLDSMPPYIRQKILSRALHADPGFRPRRLVEIEREYARRTVRYFQNDRSRAAEALGIDAEHLAELLL